jgi:hypothetical protein
MRSRSHNDGPEADLGGENRARREEDSQLKVLPEASERQRSRRSFELSAARRRPAHGRVGRPRDGEVPGRARTSPMPADRHGRQPVALDGDLAENHSHSIGAHSRTAVAAAGGAVPAPRPASLDPRSQSRGSIPTSGPTHPRLTRRSRHPDLARTSRPLNTPHAGRRARSGPGMPHWRAASTRPTERGSRLQVPGSRFRFQVPDSRFQVPGSGSKFQVQVPSSGFRCQVPVSGAEFPVPRCAIPRPKDHWLRTLNPFKPLNLEPGTWNLEPWKRVSRRRLGANRLMARLGWFPETSCPRPRSSG